MYTAIIMQFSEFINDKVNNILREGLQLFTEYRHIQNVG